jgi:hypothetical protein
MAGYDMNVPTFDSVQPDRIGRASCDEVQAAFDRLRSAAAASSVEDPGPLEAAAALRSLRRAFAQHVAATEAEGGLFDEVLATQPRLAPKVTKLCRNHRDAETVFSSLARAVAVGDIDAVHARFENLTHVLATHAAQGASLMHEAYGVDIGGD